MRSSPRACFEHADGMCDSAAAILAELVECLQAESDALVAADIEGLAQAVERKEHALKRLVPQLEGAREVWLRTEVGNARELNVRNARLLAARMNATRARLDALLGAPGAGPLYSPDGRAAGADGHSNQRGVRA